MGGSGSGGVNVFCHRGAVRRSGSAGVNVFCHGGGHFSAADAAAGEETQDAHFPRGGGAEKVVSPAQEETTCGGTIRRDR